MPFSFLVFALSGTAAFALSLLFSPLSARVALQIGALDIPDAGRHRHARPTPRLGGLGLFFAFLLPFLLVTLGAREGDGRLFYAAVTGGLFSTALGMQDDVRPLSAEKKLLWEMGIAALPLALGLSMPFFAPCLGGAAAFVLILAMMNAQNLVDGHDGLSAALSATGLFGILLLSWHADAYTVTGAAALLLFSVLGFLPYNLPNARLFMGDTGSLTLGYLEAVLLLSLVAEGGVGYTLPAVFCYFLPLLELTLSAVRRTLTGRSPFSADRAHLHHRLTDAGLSKGDVLTLLLLIALFFMLFGVFIAFFI